jgi:phosphatidylglycerol lysyltransferase
MKLWHRSRATEQSSPEPLSLAQRQQFASHSGNGLAFLTLYAGWQYFDLPGKGYVAFERHARTAVVCGDPVCAAADAPAVLAAFLEYCAAARLTPAFANASEALLPVYTALGLTSLKIGEEPVFDTARWAPRGDRAKKARSAANQARKGGVTIEVFEAGTRPSTSASREVEEVIAQWRKTRKVHALGFTLRLAPLTLAEDKIVLFARAEGRLEAFLTCVPYADRSAYYLEDLIRRDDAPTGASELLVMAAVEECQKRGATVANFGLAPLRGCRNQQGRRLLGRLLDFTFRRLNVFYRFKPLEHFKAKFAPSAWEPAYLVYPPGKLPSAALGLLSAFTPGKAGPITTAVSRVRKQGPFGSNLLDIPLAAVSAVVSALVVAAVWQHPDAEVDVFQFVTHPMFLAESLARAHLVVDSVLLAAGAGWYARNRRP